jgi:hypothetical protein
MKYSESQANRLIDKISDQYAFNRYTIKAAMEDDGMAYLFECFFKHEIDLETGKAVTKRDLEKQLIEFNREISKRSSEAQFIAENRLVKQDTRLGQVYYETLIEEPAD